MKLGKRFLILGTFVGLISCNTTMDKKTVEVQGHRGDQGYFPANTIPGFISATQMGVDVLELDVVISSDNKVVVSHEPYMKASYVNLPNGTPISKAEEKAYNLYTMPYDSIKKFDVGTRKNNSFPEQKHQELYKPLLAEVFTEVEKYIKANSLPPIKYNIEIKSAAKQYHKFQPVPSVFVDLVMKEVKAFGLEENINIQSFDPEILEQMHKNYPHIKLAYLVGKGTFEENMNKLSFTPEIYSPNYKLLTDKKTVAEIRNKKMQVIPWTVNDTTEMKRLIGINVNGIITDYPNKLLKILED